MQQNLIIAPIEPLGKKSELKKSVKNRKIAMTINSFFIFKDELPIFSCIRLVNDIKKFSYFFLILVIVPLVACSIVFFY